MPLPLPDNGAPPGGVGMGIGVAGIDKGMLTSPIVGPVTDDSIGTAEMWCSC